MTQVEIPQISLQRYLDLLKRRRWQVVPVSLLGLLIGGLVAFFIPRYYVAETLVVHELVPGKAEPRDVEDPFRAIVDSARLTMRLAIGETMRELRWPEALVDDPSLRTQNERAVDGRLKVDDMTQSDRERKFAQIRVSYRDRDGIRAADFLNQLVQTWLEARLRSFREPAEAERKAAAEELANKRRLYDQLLEETSLLAKDYVIDPTDELRLLRMQQRAAEQRVLEERRDAMDAEERKVEGLRRLLARDRDELAGIEPRIVPDPDVLRALAAKTPEGAKITALLEYYRQKQRTFRPGTEQHDSATRGIAEQEAKLRVLVGAAVDADGTMPNPEWTEVRDRIVQRERDLELAEAAVDTLRRQLATETARVVGRAAGLADYEKKMRQFEEAEKELDDASQRLRDAEKVVAELGKKQTVHQVGRAQPPPRPTEPNILVIALLGCVLGLGIAMGLVLLLDFVQGTYKTIEDVERGLPVPVLGGMSHLETEAERQGAARRRRRASLTAAALVAMVVVVVTIFYVDPTRLPPAVRDLLAMLLGA